jgi:dihydropyrimidinase
MVRREGVTSFKLFTAYPGFYQLDDGSLLRVLQRTRENGGLVCVHAENGPAIEVLVEQALARGETAPALPRADRPARLEGEATAGASRSPRSPGAPLYVVHLTARESLEPVREARLRGQTVWAETCPQYLVLSQRDIDKPGMEGAKVVFSPPVRAPGNEEHLWRGLALGDLATVGTDHCPFLFKGQKDQASRFTEIPNGLPGIETRLMLLWDEGVRTGRLDVKPLRAAGEHRAGEDLRPVPEKGALVPGADRTSSSGTPSGRRACPRARCT